MDIAGAVVVVTGGSSGIGAATAKAAAAAGARVVLAARRIGRLNALAAELPDALPLECDVTVPGALDDVVQATLARYGRVDVMVNNAGQGLHVPLADVDLDDLRAILELNVVALLAGMQAVVPVMREQGRGAIVNVSSGTTRRALPGVGAYAASKAAVNMLSAVAREELAPYGIVVSTVLPFITDTEFHDTLRAGSLSQRMAPGDSPEKVADAILDVVRTGQAEAALLPPGFAAGQPPVQPAR